MSDLIERQAAIDGKISVQRTNGVEIYSDDVVPVKYLENLPSAQPERKTGHWLDMGDFEQCSVCKCTQLKEFQTVYGKATWIKSPYCPNCGAKMEGVES